MVTNVGVEAGTTTGTDRWAIHLREWPLLLFLAAIPVSALVYLNTGWNLPLWFDETFTGTIATQPTIHGLIGWCLSELSGPAFYMPMWLWVKLAGASDAALRAPALGFALATPLLIAWRGHRERDLRLFWGALILLWLPMVAMATEARSYPLLSFLCAMQAVAFVKFARTASPANAFLWSTACAAAILTHYYAASVVLFQALALVAVHRRALLPLYPAVLPFLVAAAWIAFHFNFLIRFATGHVANYVGMSPLGLLAAPNFLFGQGPQAAVMLALIIFTRPSWWDRAKSITPEALLVWAGLAAFFLIIVAGIFNATFQPRYLTPAVPALLFGVACWADGLRSRQPAIVLLAFAALFAAMITAPLLADKDDRFAYRRHFQFETASQWLGEAEIERLHFLWLSPTGAISPSPRLADVAGFFFRRSGHPVEVEVSRGGAEPNAALLAAAGDDPRAGLLWISDRMPTGVTTAIDRYDHRWQCRNFGSDRYLVYACRRRVAA